MIAVLIIAICAAVHEPTGLRLICRADRSEPMPVAQCETARGERTAHDAGCFAADEDAERGGAHAPTPTASMFALTTRNVIAATHGFAAHASGP